MQGDIVEIALALARGDIGPYESTKGITSMWADCHLEIGDFRSMFDCIVKFSKLVLYLHGQMAGAWGPDGQHHEGALTRGGLVGEDEALVWKEAGTGVVPAMMHSLLLQHCGADTVVEDDIVDNNLAP